jgi:hypothetical protein
LKKRYKKRQKGRDEEEEEVSSYWLALRNGEYVQEFERECMFTIWLSL